MLDKILGEIRRQMRVHPDEELLNAKQLDMLESVTRVYRQQKNHFKSGDSRESIPNRIVSLSKPHIRPIVRGKETKTVEFGAKCNNILIDRISFIEKLSFNAFNEGTRLKHCVSLSKKLTGVDVKKIGGDQGYSGNDNRTFCKENGIETSFTRKGRTGKNEVKNATKRELARVRATAMEGSFGTQEGALWSAKDCCKNKINRDPANLLRYPHSKCGKSCKTRVCPSSSCSLMFHVWNTILRDWWL